MVVVALPQERLDLEERVAHVEFDGRVGPGQSNIGEKRAEPGIRLGDTLEVLVALRARYVGGTTRQQGPAGRGARQIAAPNLHDPWLARRGEKGRRQQLERIGRRDLEHFAKAR